jgi:hypothetical protein
VDEGQRPLQRALVLQPPRGGTDQEDPETGDEDAPDQLRALHKDIVPRSAAQERLAKRALGFTRPCERWLRW